MKQVIDGKLYNTQTAERLHGYEHGSDPGNFSYYLEHLYKTKKGNYFLAGSGGPMSKYSEPLGSGSYGGGEGIEPVSPGQAVLWLEEHGGTQVIIDEFPDHFEEA